ncbi:hypothetical protein ACL6C3_10260 [Capilliphycus salinus ALCB114379]|uniref:hypothetical protein n=1 Tax=Capilliphycus salinus TaxID=2768948 RepID=UPI0039A7555A
MSDPSNYSITLENQEIVVRLNRELIDVDSLRAFLDYLELESIRKRSQLTVEQATGLAEEIDRAIWDSIQSKFTENS